MRHAAFSITATIRCDALAELLAAGEAAARRMPAHAHRRSRMLRAIRAAEDALGVREAARFNPDKELAS